MAIYFYSTKDEYGTFSNFSRPPFDDAMFRAVLAKFRAHADLARRLLSTGEEEIIEKTTRDYYWGCGTDGTVQNKPGKILMRVRAESRNA